MDQNNLNNNAEQVSPQKSGTGAIAGAVVIILLLALGAFYFWGTKLNLPDTNPPPVILSNETASALISSDTSAGLPPQGTSDDVDAISADLQAMNIDQLNSENSVTVQTFGTIVQ